MKTILVCNQKGGVGKSLVADEIAFSFERSGIPVSFYDLDAQGGTLHKTNEADGAQVAVVDTPGALQEALSDWLKEADVVVIPTRTTSRDIEPLMRMRKAVFKHGRAKIVYVMNGWNRFKASRDFMEWFGGLAGDQTVVHAAPVRGVRAGRSGWRVRGRARPQEQGREGDDGAGGHGARGCGVPGGITAGQSRVPYGQIESEAV